MLSLLLPLYSTGNVAIRQANLIKIPKNDQIKLLLDKMKAVRTG